MERGTIVEALAGLKVLVVEDDYFVATDCADVLRNSGATVLGPVGDSNGARSFLESEGPDCVVLDLNLKGEMVFDLARELLDRGVATILTTGYDVAVLPPALHSAPCLQKPVDTRELIRTVRRETDARLATAP
jgi:DNA-binding response OmpR family regulator